MPYRYWRFVLYCVRTLYIQNWKTAVTRSCEIEKLVGTHIWKLCVLLRSRVLYAPLIGVTMRSRDHIGYDTVNIRLILFPISLYLLRPSFVRLFLVARLPDLGWRSRLSYLPPTTTYGSSLKFYREEILFGSFFPRRLASNWAYPSMLLLIRTLSAQLRTNLLLILRFLLFFCKFWSILRKTFDPCGIWTQAPHTSIQGYH